MVVFQLTPTELRTPLGRRYNFPHLGQSNLNHINQKLNEIIDQRPARNSQNVCPRIH